MVYKLVVWLFVAAFTGLASCAGEKATAPKCIQLSNQAVDSFFENRHDPEALEVEVISKLERAADMCPSDYTIGTNLLIYLDLLERDSEALSYAQKWLKVNGDSAMFLAFDAIHEWETKEGQGF